MQKPHNDRPRAADSQPVEMSVMKIHITELKGVKQRGPGPEGAGIQDDPARIDD
jgi:hypothetical protein